MLKADGRLPEGDALPLSGNTGRTPRFPAMIPVRKSIFSTGHRGPYGTSRLWWNVHGHYRAFFF